MDKYTQAFDKELHALAEDARALLSATAHVAEEEVVQARKRLAAALEATKQCYGRLRAKAIDGAKAADKAIRDHPYETLGIAFGAGALLGLLLNRRN